MHTQSLEKWQYAHRYHPETQNTAELRTRAVVALTLIMMIVELVAGYLTGSLALTADGWHMGSHVAALGITAFGYAFARRHAQNTRFTFGTGKVGSLAGYTSAVALAVIALLIALQSVQRLFHPVPIEFDEALPVAFVGFAVNLLSAYMLGGHHQRQTGENSYKHADASHDKPSHGRHFDHNLRAAYVHVLADALTSILAIIALLSGKLFGWVWMDSLMGIIGSIVIANWSIGLLRDTGQVLLDAEDNSTLTSRIYKLVEADSDNRIADFHLWRIGPASQACVLSIVTHHPKPTEHYKAILAGISGLHHITVEINACSGGNCAVAA
jgi:cation diffusion facilitator family transporter